MEGYTVKEKLLKPTNIDARKSNDQCLKKSFRNSSEYFGVDTSEMEIYPCDGDLIMKNKPI